MACLCVKEEREREGQGGLGERLLGPTFHTSVKHGASFRKLINLLISKLIEKMVLHVPDNMNLRICQIINTLRMVMVSIANNKTLSGREDKVRSRCGPGETFLASCGSFLLELDQWRVEVGYFANQIEIWKVD